jgi:hypothetical protein
LHRTKFVEAVKDRVRKQHGKLVCENLGLCPLFEKVKYEEHWLEADHIKEINEFDDLATIKEMNDPIENGILLCKLCHANKNIIKRPRKSL